MQKHPRGLPFLFFTEMWERFGYYLMIGIFTLYLKDAIAAGGFGMSESDASDLYGTFIAFVFLTPFLGGLLADRVLGYRKSITLGGILMGLGYCLMSVHNLYALYAAIVLVVLGNGFFKPNISSLLGNLYDTAEYKPNKDAGYNIFYMGINVGAFICNFFGAAMQSQLGWGAAFLTAGVGMFIGIAIFWIGMKHYAHADVLKPAKPEDMQLGRIVAVILLPSIAFAAIGYFIPYVFIKSKSTDAFMFACIPIVYYYVSLYTKAEATEKKPIAAMLAIFAVSSAFWAVFKQNGAALTTWADKYTDRAVPAAVLAPAQALYLTKDISAKPDSVANLDAQFRKIDDTKIVGQDPYFKNLPAEQMPAGEGKVTVFATNLFQSINPGWVILLTPVVVGFFGLMRSRRREPSTPTKIFYGLLISALSMFCMLGAVIAGSNGAEKVSPLWLFATYGVLTIGELCLSPMGLSLVSKLAPPRLVSVMMGGWFLATSIGNKLAGVLSSLWDTYDDKRLPWLLNMALLGAAALIIFSMLKWLRGIFSNY